MRFLLELHYQVRFPRQNRLRADQVLIHYRVYSCEFLTIQIVVLFLTQDSCPAMHRIFLRTVLLITLTPKGGTPIQSNRQVPTSRTVVSFRFLAATNTT